MTDRFACLAAAFPDQPELVDCLCLAALATTCQLDDLRSYVTAHVLRDTDSARLERTREALFQCIAVVGAPRVIDALSVFRDACGGDKAQWSLAIPNSRQLANAPLWHDRGAALFAQVYDDKTALVRTVLRRGAPSLELFIITAIYGAILSDDTLPLLTRELLNVICLRSMSAEAQSVGHERAALRLGATEAQLDAVRGAALAALSRYVGQMHAKLNL